MRTPADQPDAAARFETFYKDVRGRLLLQTWALTGDLTAAQKGVRDAFVVAWHHWPKVSQLDDPESYVRPLAWSRAARRATVRPFHRERNLDEDTRATLTALHDLPAAQRRVLLLAHLTTLPLEDLAREVGVPLARAENELQAATTAFALRRGVPATGILRVFEPMAEQLRDIRWPRPTIVARAGSTRRRLHTGLGVLIALGGFTVAGVVATDADGGQPSLSALRWQTPPEPSAKPEYPLTTDALLSEGIVTNELPGTWTIDLTSDNTSGDGLVLPCQRARFAARDPQAALTRRLTSTDDRTVSQAIEVSASDKTARLTWQASREWYAACDEPNTQLMSTRTLTGVGDEATQMVLKEWGSPARTLVATVARTGVLTTTVVNEAPAAAEHQVSDNVDLASLAVTKLCTLPGAGACAGQVTSTAITPLPAGKNPAMLGTWDLPPVIGVPQPWDATDPVPAKTNLAATRCDSSVFTGKGVTGGLTRSFVIPTATNLPAQFGLTETIGTWPSEKAATAFVTNVRAKLLACPKKDLGSKVERIETSTTDGADVTVWRVTVDISDKASVVFLMAVARNGRHVAQVGFVPDGAHTIADGDFVELAHRAAARLGVLG